MSGLRILRVCEEELENTAGKKQVWDILLPACCHPDPILGEETERWMDKWTSHCTACRVLPDGHIPHVSIKHQLDKDSCRSALFL